MPVAAASPLDPLYRSIYRVRPADPLAHLFEVEIQIACAGETAIRLDMPAWIPGSYMIRDFARNVGRIAASDSQGRALGLEKLDKQTWNLDLSEASGDLVRLTYRVFAWDLSVRAAHFDRTHGYFNGPALLLRVAGLDGFPVRIDLLPPEDPELTDWELATSLVPLAVESSGFGSYRADSYADLIDHPVEMGRFDSVRFEVHGLPHRLALSGRQRADLPRLARDLGRICGEHAALFGGLPLDRYLFLATALGEGYGGLEHRFSTSLICARDDLPRQGDDEAPSEGYRRFLGLCSHEYFHLWLVKRIRPLALMEGGMSSEVHTRLLWAFEGIVSYYDDLALVRSGCIDTKPYLQLLAENLTRVYRAPGRLVQTLAESSFDAWTKLYKADENAPNAIVSYYTKGALVALALDLTLRRDTDGQVSLDDVLRALWVRHGQPGIGVPERGVEQIAAEVSGLDLDGFFAQALDSTEDLDLAPLLASVGIEMRLRPQTGPKDQGGFVERFEPAKSQPTLAVRLRPGSAEAALAHVLTRGAGERAGLAPGDVVVAVDGLRATAESFDRLVGRLPPGEPLRLHIFRRDELLELTAYPQPAAADTCELKLAEMPTESALRARASWLASASGRR